MPRSYKEKKERKQEREKKKEKTERKRIDIFFDFRYRRFIRDQMSLPKRSEEEENAGKKKNSHRERQCH